MTNDSLVYDKHGQLVRRLNGIAQDGDKLVIGMRLMDAASTSSVVTLLNAACDALPSRDQLDAAYQARCDRLEDAWRHPEHHDAERTVLPTSVDDAIAQRNARLENAWRS